MYFHPLFNGNVANSVLRPKREWWCAAVRLCGYRRQKPTVKGNPKDPRREGLNFTVQGERDLSHSYYTLSVKPSSAVKWFQNTLHWTPTVEIQEIAVRLSCWSMTASRERQFWQLGLFVQERLQGREDSSSGTKWFEEDVKFWRKGSALNLSGKSSQHIRFETVTPNKETVFTLKCIVCMQRKITSGKLSAWHLLLKGKLLHTCLSALSSSVN